MARSTKPKIEVELPKLPDPSQGGGSWPLRLDHVENWAWQNNIFTPEELNTIISIGESTQLVKATTHSPVQNDKDRNSFVAFLFPNEMTGWIFARLTDAINAINEQFFQFDLTGMEQGLQFTKYTAPGEHYDWHMDKGYMTPSRKLSLSVQLSDPKDYKGGEFEMMFGRKPQRITRERGMTAFFPSYTVHRVRPVTQGTRYSLVAWVSGPPFK